MSKQAAPLTVLLAGATGLVGRACLDALATEPSVGRVVAVVRGDLPSAPARVEVRRVDFESLGASLRDMSADVAICCLGTTIRKAGSREAFRKVDHDYVVAFARAAREAGVTHFLVVTAIGADRRSLAFYNRVKGEVEADLATLGFEALTIARPSLLLGERAEFRFGERLAAPFSRFLPERIRGIDGLVVGRALVRLAIAAAHGVRIVPSAELAVLGS